MTIASKLSLEALAVAAALVGAALAAAEVRPLWSYHNGNTLFASPPAYQQGYAIGVLDGYLAAHERARENGEGPEWLDLCLSNGRTASAVSAELLDYFRQAFRSFDQAAPDILLDHMQLACARGAVPAEVILFAHAQGQPARRFRLR